jgi:hypothetical protein
MKSHEEQTSLPTVTRPTIVSLLPPTKISWRGPASTASSISSENSDSYDLLSKEGEEEILKGVPPSSTSGQDQDSHSDSRNESRESSPRVKFLKRPLNVVSSSVSNGNKAAPSDLSDITFNVPASRRPTRVARNGQSSAAVSHAPPTKKARTTKESSTIVPALLSKMSLLAHAMDDTVLSPLHVFIRQHIEVFTATREDIAQPAPGRKNPIQLHQVGIRCIHCRDLPPRDRVKRAVCYPSCVGRVYHSVSDMKFDHFHNCKGVPHDVQAKLQDLKQESRKKKPTKKSPSSSKHGFASTAQYYHDSARRMSMTDDGGGVFMSSYKQGLEANDPEKVEKPKQQQASSSKQLPPPIVTMPLVDSLQTFNITSLLALAQRLPLPFRFQPDLYPQSYSQRLVTPVSFSTTVNRSSTDSLTPLETQKETPTAPTQSNSALLSSPSDPQHLNGIHCFVRRHLEVFAANNDDVNAPAPGRRTRIVLGQVGIRCIHCASLPPRRRVKRSICYPPSVKGMYHAVSNMKFDHFGICRSLPVEARAEFASLRASCTRRIGASEESSNTASAGSKNKKGSSSSSTAQYYHASGKKLGLVDTDSGIRFKHLHQAVENIESITMSAEGNVSDGISALMIAALNGSPNQGCVF